MFKKYQSQVVRNTVRKALEGPVETSGSELTFGVTGATGGRVKFLSAV